MPSQSGPTTPNWQRHQAIPPARFRLFPFRSPLLRESLLLSVPRGTEMFQFPRFPLLVLCVRARVTPHDGCRVSPFGHPRVVAWSAAHRGFSQPPTSFIGSRRQGIHRWLFVAWISRRRCSCSLCNSQRSGAADERRHGGRRARTARAGASEGVRTRPEPLRGVRVTSAPSKRNRRRTVQGTTIEEGLSPTTGSSNRGRPIGGQLGVSLPRPSGCSSGTDTEDSLERR
jgi:hypothetical protein